MRFLTIYYILEILMLVNLVLIKIIIDQRWVHWMDKHSQHIDTDNKCCELTFVIKFFLKSRKNNHPGKAICYVMGSCGQCLFYIEKNLLENVTSYNYF